MQWKETKIGRRLRCSGKPWRISNSACMYQPKHRTQVSSGIGCVHRRVAVHGDDLEVGVDAVAAQLGTGPLAEPREQRDQLRVAVQPHAAVPDQVAERGDALDVVADVRRRALGARDARSP